MFVSPARHIRWKQALKQRWFSQTAGYVTRMFPVNNVADNMVLSIADWDDAVQIRDLLQLIRRFISADLMQIEWSFQL